MSVIKKYIILILILFINTFVYSQNNCGWSTLDDANEKYKIGNFEETISIINNCINTGFDETQQVEGYRLLAKTYLALDNDSSANIAASKLMKINQKFRPDFLSDPPKFMAIIKKLRENNSAVMITSVSKKSENILEAPATVLVITEDDIIERGYTNIEEIFHDLPGFDVIRGRGPVYSLMYQRGYRSISNDRTILLIDGIEENDLASDNMAISRQYPLSHIKRIEYVYGPASTMYGANAFAGVINIVTKQNGEYFTEKKNVAADATVSYGSMNTKIVDATVVFRAKKFSLSVTGRYFDDKGLDISSYDEWNFNLSEIDYASAINISGENADGGYLAQDYIDENGLDALNSQGLYTITRNAANIATNINLTQSGINQARLNDSLILYQKGGEHPSVVKNDKNWFLKARVQTGNFTIGIQSWKIDDGLAPWYTDSYFVFRENRSRWIAWNSLLFANYEYSLTDKIYFTNLLSYRIHEIDGGTNFELFYGYLNNRRTFADLINENVPSVTTIYYYRTSNQLRDELRFTYTPNKKIDVLFGTELRSSMIQGNYIKSYNEINPDEAGDMTAQSFPGTTHFRTFDVGVFSQLSYKIFPVLTFTLGGRGDYNQIRTTGGYGFVFNPRVALIYHSKKIIFKAIYSEAFKDASYLQRYATSESRQLNNPNLDPEKVKNIEVSAYWKIIDNLNIHVAAYSSYYENSVKAVTVTMDNGTQTEQFQAVGGQVIRGVQSEINYKLGSFKFHANYTYTLPIDEENDLSISDIAAHKANFSANFKFYKYFNLNLRANYVGDRKSGENTSGSRNPITEFEPFVVLNSSLSASNFIKDLSISLSVNNILDTEYFVPGVRDADGVRYASRFPQFGRTFNLSLTYKL